MERPRDRVQASKQAAGGSIEQLVVDAEHSLLAHCGRAVATGVAQQFFPAERDLRRRTTRPESHQAATTRRLQRSWFFLATPTNSPPAASTSSAIQGCDAMIGLPHSSQNTFCGADPDVSCITSSMRSDMRAMTPLPCFARAHHSGNGRDVGINVSQGSRGESKKAHAGLQDFGNGFQLIRN